ncbi:MAG: hypothetical protein Ct9H300mP27_06470 [Chloroflexota bacterium]|nr:MAG: hypothetical protein Ct9H300mP27_06470 [Chloroflexota bacterium]
MTPAKLEADFDENITVVRVPLDSIMGLIGEGQIQDSKSVASLLLAIQYLDSVA